jgi:hypothetical protein
MTRNGWIGIGLTVSAAALMYGLFLRHGVAPAVVGYNVVPSERVLSGEVPYRDFIYNYTPGVLWLNAILFKFLGTTLMTARLGVYAAKLATAALMYWVARRYLAGWLALLPVLMTLCWVGYGDILKVFPTQYGIVLLLGAWVMLNNSETANRRSSSDDVDPRMAQSGSGAERVSFRDSAILGIAGMLGAGVILFKQNVGIFACAAIVFTAAGWAWSRKESWAWSRKESGATGRAMAVSRTMAVLGGILLAGVPAAIYLASRSALVPMLYHFRRHAVAYQEAKGIALPTPSTLVASGIAAIAVVGIGVLIFKKAGRLIPSYSGLVAVVLLIVIAIGDRGPSGLLYRSLAAQVYYLPIYAALAGGIWVLALYLRGDRERAAGLIGLVLIPAAAFIEVFPRSDADHLVRVLPPSLLLVCVLAVELGRRLAAGSANVASGASLLHDERAAVGDLNANAFNNAAGRAPSHRRPHQGFPSFFVAAVALVISAIGLRVTWAPQFDGGFRMVENTPLQFERARGVCGSQLEADRFNRIVEYIEQHTSPGDPIFTTARKMTALYFFAGRPNTTRMLWFDSPGIPREDRDLVYQAIAEHRFKLILTGAGDESGELGDGGAQRDRDLDQQTSIEVHESLVSTFLREHYHKTAFIDGISIFEPNS